MKKLVIAGGSGFLGRTLSQYFSEKFDEIIILSRTASHQKENITTKIWDNKTIGSWQAELEGADALINLTGKSVNCRYTNSNKNEILRSRIDSVKALGEAVRNCKSPPRVWLQASSSTIYRSSNDKIMNERNGEIGDDFSMNVCKQWERSFLHEECRHTKKIVMRIAIVLGGTGGAIPSLFLVTKLGLGGKQGSGNQMVSWIHEQDFARATDWLIHHGKNNGIYNCSSPNPVTNFLFMQSLRKSRRIPFGIPTPKWLLEIGSFIVRTETELLLKSRWVYPQRLLDEGFAFTYDNIGSALNSLTTN